MKAFFYTLNCRHKKNTVAETNVFLSVRVEGLEPPSLAALDPKSSVSTNFTTPAYSIYWKGSKGKDYSSIFANIFTKIANIILEGSLALQQKERPSKHN